MEQTYKKFMEINSGVVGKTENIKLMKEYKQDFTNDNVVGICKYGKIENIKLIKKYNQDFTSNNVRYISEYGKIENIKLYFKSIK